MSSITANLKAAGQHVVDGMKFVGKLPVDDSAQRTFEGNYRAGVDLIYNGVSQATQKTVNFLENDAVAILRKPIGTAKISRFNINPETMTESQVSIRKVGNAIKAYHEKVTNGVEKAAVTAGDKAHAFTRLILEPVRFVTKLLQMENLGAIIQNSIALVVGFVVRAIVSTVGQIVGHVAPYALVGGALAASGFGIAALAKVSIFAAFAVVQGLIDISLFGAIANLKGKVESLTHELKQSRKSSVNKTIGTVKQAAKKIAAQLNKHKGKVALATVFGTAAVLGYTNSDKVIELAKTGYDKLPSIQELKGAVKPYTPEFIANAYRKAASLQLPSMPSLPSMPELPTIAGMKDLVRPYSPEFVKAAFHKIAG